MPKPTDIKLHRQSAILDIVFDDGVQASLSAEYLRVHSPSAEVKGHGRGQEVLQVGKENVAIDNIEPVGQYAVRLIFSDGHQTGLYSWDYLYELATQQEEKWQAYLQRLHEAGYRREHSGGGSVKTYKPD
jgi:DUF971 family protein